MTALTLVPLDTPKPSGGHAAPADEARSAASAGWHESSHELRLGLQVIDLGEWLDAAVLARPSLRPFFALLPSAACA